VSDHRSLFFVLIAIFVMLAVVIAGYYLYRARKTSHASWENLLRRLTYIDRAAIETVAFDIIDSTGQPRQDEDSALLEPSEIWDRIGGWKGLETLQANCAVLIDLAFYVQQWYPEAIAVTEQLRLSTREIEGHIKRLKAAEKTGKLDNFIPMYAQRAVATYYVMTRSVLSLYEQSNGAMLGELQRAL
jgi:hypothetical protein